LSSVLRPLQHSIGYMGDGFYRSIKVSKYWRRSCTGKQHKKHKENRKYTHTHTK